MGVRRERIRLEAKELEMRSSLTLRVKWEIKVGISDPGPREFAAGPNLMHNLLTVKETAEYLRIPLPTVYYLVQRGQLPAIQIGGRWRIKKDSLDRDILREQEQGQPTVLVIDDDVGVQGMFKLFLKKSGFSRMIVGSGKEGIAALKKQKFDLLFLDLMLPDTTGDVIYAEAKEIAADLPIVIITGYPDSDMLDNILKHGPVTVLKKPLKVEQVAQTLKYLGHKIVEVQAA
jgi:excisionase family DNA binding protein